MDGDLNLMAPDGSERRGLTFGERVLSYSSLGWSPDGRIAYAAAWEGNEEVYVINADGTGPHVNVSNGPQSRDRSPTWRR